MHGNKATHDRPDPKLDPAGLVMWLPLQSQVERISQTDHLLAYLFLDCPSGLLTNLQ